MLRVSRRAWILLVLPFTGCDGPDPMENYRSAEPFPLISASPEDVLEGHVEVIDDVILVFVGATFCGALDHEAMPAVIDEAKVRLRERALDTDRRFVAKGVALDWSVSEGLGFLRQFGEFDEVLAGRNWLNTGAARYMWTDIPGPAAVPQLLVLLRSAEVSAQGIEFGEERLLLRKLGVEEILEWADLDFPLSFLE
jgi:hypothetical protein